MAYRRLPSFLHLLGYSWPALRLPKLALPLPKPLKKLWKDPRVAYARQRFVIAALLAWPLGMYNGDYAAIRARAEGDASLDLFLLMIAAFAIASFFDAVKASWSPQRLHKGPLK